MSWNCVTCDRTYDPSVLECLHCAAEEAKRKSEAADADAPKYVEQLTVCENCRHKHHDGVYCHMYIESSIKLEGMIVDEDADFDDGYVEPAANEPDGAGGDKKAKKPLNTPMFVKRINYIRCNCTVGVPSSNTRFKALPKELIVKGTDLRILTYDLIMAGANIPLDLTAEKIEQNRRELINKVGDHLPCVLPFLPLCQNAHLANTCKRWSMGANQYPDYVDVRNFVPWQCIRPHQGQVLFYVLLYYKVTKKCNRSGLLNWLVTGYSPAEISA
jgi:hypothetical protein